VNNLHIISLYKLHNKLSCVSSQRRRASRTRRVECVKPCCLTSSTQPKCMGSTRRMCRVMSCWDVTSQVEFGLMSCTEATGHVRYKNQVERERCGSGRSLERERSGERAKSAAQNALLHKTT